MSGLVGIPAAHYLLYNEGHNPQWSIHDMFNQDLSPLGPYPDYTILIYEVINRPISSLITCK